jgi:hypothetical protein
MADADASRFLCRITAAMLAIDWCLNELLRWASWLKTVSQAEGVGRAMVDFSVIAFHSPIAAFAFVGTNYKSVPQAFSNNFVIGLEPSGRLHGAVASSPGTRKKSAKS